MGSQSGHQFSFTETEKIFAKAIIRLSGSIAHLDNSLASHVESICTLVRGHSDHESWLNDIDQKSENILRETKKRFSNAFRNPIKSDATLLLRFLGQGGFLDGKEEQVREVTQKIIKGEIAQTDSLLNEMLCLLDARNFGHHQPEVERESQNGASGSVIDSGRAFSSRQ